jgi:2'-5' RNA ligase
LACPCLNGFNGETEKVIAGKTMRLFFALWPPPAALDSFGRMARDCAGQFGGQPSRQESIHLTLAFLGQVSEAQLPLLIQKAQEIRHAAFALTIDRLRCWQHKHLLWAGCASPNPELLALFEMIQTLAGDLGITLDKRGFTPHLTLVRKLPTGAETLPVPEIHPIHWDCSEFVLVQSCVTASGPQYRSISVFPLAKE